MNSQYIYIYTYKNIYIYIYNPSLRLTIVTKLKERNINTGKNNNGHFRRCIFLNIGSSKEIKRRGRRCLGCLSLS